MRNRKLVHGLRLTVLVAVLLIGTTALAGPLGYYNWTASTTGYVGEFTNSSTGGGVKANTAGTSSIGLYGYATGSSAQGTRGYNTTTGYGVYGRSVSGTGVYGENNSSTSGYGGFFKGFNGLKGYTTAANGYGGWFTASGSTGFGVRAQGSGANGYGVYSTGTVAGVYAEGADGVWGVTSTNYGDALEADASGLSAWGLNATASGQSGHAVAGSAYGLDAYGGKFTSDEYTAVYAEGDGSHPDLVAPHYIQVGGDIIPGNGGLAFLARNDGGSTLEPGDLVVFRGVDPSALGYGVVLADRAGASSGVLVGVVLGAYVVEETAATVPDAPAEPAPPDLQEETLVPPAPVPEGEEPRAEEESTLSPEAAPAPSAQPPKVVGSEQASGRLVEGQVEAGQYMVVSYMGLIQVRVNAKGPIRAGDWIVVAPDGSVSGAPVSATTRLLERGYTIVGRALEGLESGTGRIYVQVNIQ
jgi:hypothetical protein